MLLKRFYHDGLAQASYLVGCQRTGEAIVIDALRHPEPYLKAAAANDLRITQVTETHIHADYLSGSRELARRAGARLLLSGEGGPDWLYAFAESDGARILRHGDRIQVGNVHLDVWHTPGHTPEHLTFVLTDAPAAPQPLGAFTGDFLFVGDVGRPDLLERAANIAGTMRPGAAQLYDSLLRFTSAYPDYLQLWPGHGSGSACGKSLGAVPSSTLGYERMANWALRSTGRDAFIEEVLAGQPDPPPYFAAMKRLNRAGPALLGASPTAPRLAQDQLSHALAAGRRVVDLRPAATYAQGFVPGTINLPRNGSLVTRAGWFLDVEQEYYLLSDANDDQPTRQALAELTLIGLDRCAGWFGADVLASARERSTLLQMPQVDANAVAAQIRDGHVTVVDVRNDDEWAEGHIPGAVHIPLGRIEQRLAEVDTSRPVVVHCKSGGRSSVAASLLRARGVADVRNLEGGFVGWRRAGQPVETEARAGDR
ncbi:MAG: MBL fold metallo-hydrolase [Gemmatimonadaceae bacterium]|nr:MBL fold metallo-hydrolase [Gemmatimonadaceae bacterium]